MTRIILIRHGFSIANAEDRFAGHSDFPLSDIGHEQARRAAAWLVRREKIDKIYASDLLRAYHTATPFAEACGLSVIPDPRLREIYAGEWEGKKFVDLLNEYKEDFGVWRNDFAKARCTGGESVAELYDRTVAAVLSIAKENDGKTVLIASHATPLRAIKCYTAGDGADKMGEHSFPTNASAQIYRYENGKLTPESEEIVEYLDGLITALPKGV